MATDLSDRGETEVEDLVHHGVRGMRWGVIRKKAAAGRAATARAFKQTGRITANGVTKVKKAKQAHDARVAGKVQAKKEARARKKFGNKSYKKIGDAELQSRIKRLEQEKRYRELKADRHLVRGREVTRQILEGSLTKAGTYAGNKLLRSAFDKAAAGELGDAIGKAEKASGSKSAEKKAKKAEQAAKEAHEAVKEAYETAFKQPKAPSLPKSKPAPKQIDKPKSYKQTKPSPKKKRYPRNPGSTAK